MSRTPQQVVQQINEAFSIGKMEAILAFFTDDVLWHMVGSAPVQGKEAVRKALLDMGMEGMQQDIRVNRILDAGGSLVAEGTIHTPEGDSYAFCDIYEMKAGLIKALRSYVLKSA